MATQSQGERQRTWPGMSDCRGIKEQVIVSITLLEWGRMGISESKANLRQCTHRVWEAWLGLSDSGQLLYILGAKFRVAGSPPCV